MCVCVCLRGWGSPERLAEPLPGGRAGAASPRGAGGCELLLPALPRFLFHVSNKVGQGHTTPGLSQDDWVFNGRKGLALRPIRLSACHVRGFEVLRCLWRRDLGLRWLMGVWVVHHRRKETKAQSGSLPVLFFINKLFPEVLAPTTPLPSLEASSSGFSTWKEFSNIT